MRESGVIAPKPTGADVRGGGGRPRRLAARADLPATGVSAAQGKSVLVYGAAGSVGTAAVQLLAHHFEAEVTAVCDTKDVELVRSLGARDVLDRFREDFTKNGDDVRRDLRRGRQALVPPLPALAEARRDLHLDGPRVHVPRAAPRSRHTVRREQACDARHRPLSQGGPPPRQGARRGGQVPARDRPDVRARRDRRGDPLRRERPEDRATSCSASARLRQTNTM